MSLVLRKVELRNIRSHEHFVFVPRSEGITAIKGVIGSGKSSIVDSIAWVLFGTKPKGVSKNSDLYRDKAVWGKDKCEASVLMDVDGVTTLIQRRLVDKGKSAECDVWVVTLDEDGIEKSREHIAGPSVSHVEQKIRTLLRMDEKGFLAALLVQQKQVDYLISARSADRRETIEKMTGISSLTVARDKARADQIELKRYVDHYVKNGGVNEKEVKSLSKERDSLSKDLDRAGIKLSKSSEKLRNVKGIEASLRESLSEKEGKLKKRDELFRAKETVEARLSSGREVLNSLLEERAEKKKSLPSRSVSVESVEAELKSARATLAEADREILNNFEAIESAELLIKKNVAVREKTGFESADEVELKIDKTEKASVSIRTILEKLKSSSVALSEESRRALSAASVLESEHGSCPTCLQSVKDATEAVRMLQEMSSSALNKKAKVEAEIHDRSEMLNKAERALEKLSVILESFASIEGIEEETARRRLEAPKLEATRDRFALEVDSLGKVFVTASNGALLRAEYDRVSQRALKASDDVEKLQGKMNEIEDRMKSSEKVSESEVERLKEKLTKAQSDLVEMSRTEAEDRGAESVIREKLSAVEYRLKEAEGAVEKYKSSLAKLEIATATLKVVEEFREERIANSLPALETYASDLLSRFTDGSFTKMEIDERFNASVFRSNGVKRPVGLLSGGELSAAAMALRIAISMLLSGGAAQNFIILDEVLVSQDAMSAEAILTAIKEVCQGQVIIIAHNGSTDSIADTVVEVAN